MYRDIINMTDIDLEKLRKLSKSCSDNKKTQEYVRDVCFKLRDLLINYARRRITIFSFARIIWFESKGLTFE